MRVAEKLKFIEFKLFLRLFVGLKVTVKKITCAYNKLFPEGYKNIIMIIITVFTRVF